MNVRALSITIISLASLAGCASKTTFVAVPSTPLAVPVEAIVAETNAESPTVIETQVAKSAPAWMDHADASQQVRKDVKRRNRDLKLPDNGLFSRYTGAAK